MVENTFQAAYRDALHRAHETLRSRNIAACCAGAGAVLTRHSGNMGAIELCCLNRAVRITLPEFMFSAETEDETVSIWEQILVLHYLANSDQAALIGTRINYRRLRDGALYAEAFERRCIQPLLSAFGSEPDSDDRGRGNIWAEYRPTSQTVPCAYRHFRVSTLSAACGSRILNSDRRPRFSLMPEPNNFYAQKILQSCVSRLF